jgi:hypothetical protein
MPTTISPAALRDRLARATGAEVSFDRGTRMLYATDASPYQLEPVGVVVPRTAGDVEALVRVAAEERLGGQGRVFGIPEQRPLLPGASKTPPRPPARESLPCSGVGRRVGARPSG